MNIEQAINENRECWDSIAHLHAQGSGAAFYRIEQWLAGECKLGKWEIEEIGEVKGKSLLHLQCHIGTDTLSWARRGAKVTGLDFSTKSIAEAERFAKLLGIEDARFVVSYVNDAVSALNGETFDVLYTGRGALCWLPDLDEWASICRRLVKDGGVLYLEETHPTLSLLDSVTVDGKPMLVPKYDLFRTEPVSETEECSYADRDAKTGAKTSHCWEFRFDTLINALLKNGFQIDFLHERPECFFKPWDDELFEEIDGLYWRLAKSQVPIPMSFTLRATAV
ncbi:MAG: class I SAM-dependent methyltransferase [Verrucomicrobiota bacterium]